MFTKQCNVCKENRPLSEFAKDSMTADGLTAHCRVCGAVDTIAADQLTFCIETPIKRFSLTAAIVTNRDLGMVKYYMGRLREANALYPAMLRGMIELLTAALDEMEEGE